MILADTSAWIDFFRDAQSPVGERLAFELANDRVLLGDLIVVEILQGFRPGKMLAQTEQAFSVLSIVTLCGPAMAFKAASNYRTLRRKGVTVRGAIDVMIATWCLEKGIPLLHNDRDYGPFEEHLGLQAAVV